MANIHSVHKLYWQVLKYPYNPKQFLDVSETQEIDAPFRHGTGTAIHLPFTKYVLILGTWKGTKGESEALTYAIGGRILTDDEVDWDSILYGEHNEFL
jgi:hypothetical protein